MIVSSVRKPLRSVALFLVACFLSTSLPCQGQTRGEDPDLTLDARLIRYQFDSWAGGYFTLGEQRLAYGTARSDEPIVGVLSQFPASAQMAEEYQRLMRPGWIFQTAGLVMLVAGGSFLTYYPVITDKRSPAVEAAGLTASVAGFVAVYVGAVYLRKGEGHIMDAVWSFNREILRDHTAKSTED